MQRESNIRSCPILSGIKNSGMFMANTFLPAVQTFIQEMRTLFAEEVDDEAKWDKARNLFHILIKDPDLREHARTWPSSPSELGLEGKHANLIFYEDPDYGFVMNGLIKAPNAKTTVHDHGKSWTLYGVVAGRESVLRFDRIDGGKPGDFPETAEVIATDKIDVAPGHVDYVKPWEIHAEYNGPEPTVAVIVRSQKCGTYVQNIFYQKDSTVEQYYGPKQIPFELN